MIKRTVRIKTWDELVEVNEHSTQTEIHFPTEVFNDMMERELNEFKPDRIIKVQKDTKNALWYWEETDGFGGWYIPEECIAEYI